MSKQNAVQELNARLRANIKAEIKPIEIGLALAGHKLTKDLEGKELGVNILCVPERKDVDILFGLLRERALTDKGIAIPEEDAEYPETKLGPMVDDKDAKKAATKDEIKRRMQEIAAGEITMTRYEALYRACSIVKARAWKSIKIGIVVGGLLIIAGTLIYLFFVKKNDECDEYDCDDDIDTDDLIEAEGELVELETDLPAKGKK